jgi:hypothetical protein
MTYSWVLMLLLLVSIIVVPILLFNIIKILFSKFEKQMEKLILTIVNSEKVKLEIRKNLENELLHVINQPEINEKIKLIFNEKINEIYDKKLIELVKFEYDKNEVKKIIDEKIIKFTVDECLKSYNEKQQNEFKKFYSKQLVKPKNNNYVKFYQ